MDSSAECRELDSPLKRKADVLVGAWWSASEAGRLNCSLGDVQMMREIQRYNEVDCKVMMEIIRYLKTSSPLSC